MGDAFKLLSFGVHFDKKRYANDIALFEKPKPPVQKNSHQGIDKGENKKQSKKEPNDVKESASKRQKTNAPLSDRRSIDDEIIENSHLDFVEFSDDSDEEQYDPFAGVEEDEEDEEGEREGEGEGAKEGGGDEEVEYDFSSTDKWEGEGEGEGEEDEVNYFSTSKRGSAGEKVQKHKKKKIDLDKWEADEVARTGLALEQAREIRKKHRITVHGDEVPFPLADVDGLSVYGVREELLNNMQRLGYHTLTPVQQQAIPTIMCNREAVVCAPTGSGKTLCFALPVLHLLKEPKLGGVRAVILSPTRELAEQTYRHFKRLSVGIPFRYCLLTKPPLNEKLKIDPIFDIVITTPHRLVFLIKNNQVDLTKVQYLIFDEADRLFDENFIEQIDQIVTACKNDELKLSLLSATISPVVDELAKSVLKFPIDIHIGARNSAASTIEQQLIHVREDGKLLTLRQLIQKGIPTPVMIFVRQNSRAKYLYGELAKDKLHIDVIHSDLPPKKRAEIVTNFRIGKIWFLIATDLMARGMDFKNVGCVVNFDCPRNRATYIHRIGRTGRAGQKGKAITFYSDKDMAIIRSISNVVKEAGGVIPDWMNSLRKQTDWHTKKVFAAASKKAKQKKHLQKKANKKE